jgi:type IV secretory pathway TrbD component
VKAWVAASAGYVGLFVVVLSLARAAARGDRMLGEALRRELDERTDPQSAAMWRELDPHGELR